MSAIFRASKTDFCNLRRITLEDGNVIDGGTKCWFKVKVTGMLRGIEQDGVPNGQAAEYQAQLKIEGNEIYAVRDLTIKNMANFGNVGSEEYDDGERHRGAVEISDDLSEVTMSILNPCGTENLEMEFALISKVPIEHNMIIPQIGDLIVDNYENSNMPSSNESITITSDDYRMKNEWQMRKHANKHIRDILRVFSVPEDLNLIHNPNAGNGRGQKAKLKTGTEPSPNITDIMYMIEMNITLGRINQEVLENNTFVFVSVKGKLFILTVSNNRTLNDLKTDILNIDAALDRQTLDSLKLKNQSTGKLFNPQNFAVTTCKDIVNGARGQSHFVPQRRNIKWVSFE